MTLKDFPMLLFGAMVLPLRKQAPNLKISGSVQSNADAIVRLHVQGLLTDSEVHGARMRLLRKLVKDQA